MRNRLIFHLFHFLVLCVLIFTAVFIYYKFSYASFQFSLDISIRFVRERIANFMLIAVGAYLLAYLTGIIKFTMEERSFRTVWFLREMFKFLLLLSVIAFIEFWAFYGQRIGRLIYLWLFLSYSLYYLMYLLIRAKGGPRQLLWMAAIPWEDILRDYLKKPEAYRVIRSEEERIRAGMNINVIYQDGCLDEKTSESLIKSKLAGYTVMELAELIEKETAKIPLDIVNLHWFLDKFDVTDRNSFRVNRAFDIFISSILILLLFVPGLLVAAIHLISSRGPLFFIQERLGLHGRPFRLIKFRTMIRDAEKAGAQFAGKDDPRITRIGKFMRRLRIDEIPQLLNVLKGDMSMVGPRPERAVFVETLSARIPYYKLRLLVSPGLTGWAQINGAYAGEDTAEHREKLAFDLYYIKNKNIFLDLLILLQTVKTIVLARGE